MIAIRLMLIVLLYCAALAAVAGDIRPADELDPAGDWFGVVDTPSGPYRFDMHLRHQEDCWSGSVVMVAEGVWNCLPIKLTSMVPRSG